jgi:hypothetical protein
MAMSTSPTQATSSAAAWTRQRAHHPSGSRDLPAWARGPRRAIAWGVEAPAPTVRGWPGSCATTTRWSWRSTGPTAPPAGGAARPTPRRRGRRPRGAGRPGDRPAPRPAPGGSRCSAGCGARASAMKHAPGDQRHQGAAGHRPHDLRQQLRDLPVSQLVRTAARLRPGAITTRPRQPNWRCAPGLPPPGLPPPGLSAQIKDLDSELTGSPPRRLPDSSRCWGGHQSAGALLVAAGDNPGRLRSERPLRCCAGPRRSRLLGQDHPSPPQPWRRPPGQRRAAPHRAGAAAL